MADTNYYIGSNQVQKLMLGTNQVWEKPTSSDVTLLPNMGYMRLPSEQWIETEPNVWQQIPATNEDAISLEYLLEGDGGIFFKYVDNGFSKTPDMMLFNMPTLQSGIIVIDLWVQDGVFCWEDPHAGVQSQPAVDGTFYGLIRENGYVTIMKSIDGVNLEEITGLVANRDDLIYIQSWHYSFELNKLYYPQGRGLTTIIS